MIDPACDIPSLTISQTRYTIEAVPCDAGRAFTLHAPHGMTSVGIETDSGTHFCTCPDFAREGACSHLSALADAGLLRRPSDLPEANSAA